MQAKRQAFKPSGSAFEPLLGLSPIRPRELRVIRQHINRARALATGAGMGAILIRAVAGSGTVRIAAMLASFLVGVQLARGLGVEGYGYYGLALAIVTIAGIPGELGLPKLVTREVAASSVTKNYGAMVGVIRWADRLCWRLTALIFAGLVIAALVLFQSRPPLATALLLGSPLIPLMALSRIRGGALQGLQHIVRGQIPANLLKPLFFSVLLAILYGAGASLEPSTAMLLNSVTAGMALLIAHFWLRSRLPKSPRTEPVQNGRRWLASTIPLALTDGIRTLQTELTVLLLGLLAVASDVGLFRIAAVTATIAGAPMTVLAHVLMPMIARLHAEQDQVRLQKVVTFSAYAQAAGVLLLSLPLLIVPDYLLSLAFGGEFAGAANALRIIAVGQIANAAFGPNIALLNMTHHERRVTRAMAIGLALNAATVLLLVRHWGIEGAALGFVISLLAWNLLTWIDARRLLGIETSILPLSAKASRC